MSQSLIKPNNIAEIINVFKGNIFAHTHAEAAFSRLKNAISAEAMPQIIILTGATGVGKTTLLHAAKNYIDRSYQSQVANIPDMVPSIYMESMPPSSTNFSWKDFFMGLMTTLNEPLVGKKMVSSMQLSLFSGGRLPHPLERSTTDALRRACTSLMRHRNVKLAFLDEAHHMLLVSNRSRLNNQFELIKTFSAESNTTIVMAGTHKLLDILEQSGQLARRAQVIEFARYDMRNKGHVEEFRRVLAHFEGALKKHVPADLLSSSGFFYEKSAGCVGILKDCLTRCLEHSLLAGGKLIDEEFAKSFVMRNTALQTIAEEAFYGESRFEDISSAQLQDLLAKGILLAKNEPGNLIAQPKFSKRRAAQRNPVRDPVGSMR